ncbi:C-type lectin domain family 4 member M-like [Trachinotus anak]|uniref:C-type lectin domain family 4 member M-like n=1 Tax=Trachinotus anak TaxID=443729 RepID=UPI0039F1FF88
MSVEYHASTVTNMDIEDSKIGYKKLLADGSSKFHCSVYVLRSSPYKAATVFLGILCVLLLAGVIGQSVHYKKLVQDQQNNLTTMTTKMENLEENLKTVKKEKRDVETNRNQLQQNYEYLSKRKDQIQTNNNLLSEETNKLKLSQSQLQASNDALSKELEQLKASKNLLDTNNNALSKDRDLLRKQYDSVLKRKNELQTSFDSVTREKNNLQNKLNNVTRSKKQLQLSYNDLIKDVEHLQDKYNFSNSEKDKLSNSHQNLTIQKDTLQETYNTLKKATDELQVNYASLAQEKEELESSCKNVTTERDLLKSKIENLTVEKDVLQDEAERLNATIQNKKCPTGWNKFQYSCYFTSVGKKTWSKSREDCQSRGADLAIIKSQNEMTFINGLYGSDKEVWIGLTDEGIEGQWKWVDGTPLTTTFWGKGQPNSYDGRNQDCVEFWHRASGKGDWNDENCNIEQNYICEN